MPIPTEIRLNRTDRRLDIAFDDGSRHSYPAEYLRVESPSAEVQGHSPGQRRVPPGKGGVGIRTVEPVGNYAVRIIFDDGHDTGIFSWDYLYRLAGEHASRWAGYLKELEGLGLSR